MKNLHKIPPTRFSILQEMSMTLSELREAHAIPPPEAMLPNISQGKMFCAFLRKHGMTDPSTLHTYRHMFPNSGEVDAKLYAVELLDAFHTFIATI